MSLEYSLVVFAFLFFAIASLSQLKVIPQRFWQHPIIFALSFVGISGVVFFFGSIELVGRYGISGLLGLFAFSGIFIFAPLFIEPLRWMSRSYAFSTLPDLFFYRYRLPLLAHASTLLLCLASLPIAAAQFSSFVYLASPQTTAPSNTWLLLLGVTLVAVLFVLIFGSSKRAVKAVPGVATATTLLVAITIMCCAYFAIDQVFGNVAALNEWAEVSGQDQVIMRFDHAHVLILLFLPMSLILPHNSFMHTLSTWWPKYKHASSAWMVPAVVTLITLPIFPLLWAGLVLKIDAPMQQYINVIPYVLKQTWLYNLSILATLFVGVSLLVATAMALGKLITISRLVGDNKPLQQGHLDRWLGHRRKFYACLWLLLAMTFTCFSKSHSIADLSIAGMIGAIQLLPALIGALYAPSMNSKGVLLGMATGTIFWLYGIVLPLFGVTAPLSFLGISIPVGPENWPFWLLESLAANVVVNLSVSLLTRTSKEEQHHAHLCMVDNLPAPQRHSLEDLSVATIKQRLATWIGVDSAEQEVDQVTAILSIGLEDHRPLAQRQLRDHLNFQLSTKLGTFMVGKVMANIMPVASGGTIDDITLIESQLASAGGELSGLAAELNKLRLYHRQTLENLPTGVCSVDPEGEILLWNVAMGEYTGIDPHDAEGTLLHDLPYPWGSTLETFYAGKDQLWPAHEVDAPPKGSGWYNFSKHRMEDDSPLYKGNQVLLMEDITERLTLVKELAHAERLSSMGRMAAGVAHEIGNPVTGISCLAQDLQSETKEQETRESAATILDLTQRISNIVATLMDFSRSGSTQNLQPSHLFIAVNRAIDLLRLDKGTKTVEFRSTIAEDQQVIGDSHQLTQVFVNLLANAKDASFNGGLIEVSSEINQDQQIVAHVTDHGTGITTDLLTRVMDPFFTTKEPGEGTGLGLSLVYSIMRIHRGSINITSPVADGHGSRFSLTLNTVDSHASTHSTEH